MEIAPYLEQRLLEQYGAEETENIRRGFSAARCTTLRTNRLKGTPEETAAALEAADIPFERVPWFEDAFGLGAGMEKAESRIAIANVISRKRFIGSLYTIFKN